MGGQAECASHLIQPRSALSSPSSPSGRSVLLAAPGKRLGEAWMRADVLSSSFNWWDSRTRWAAETIRSRREREPHTQECLGLTGIINRRRHARLRVKVYFAVVRFLFSVDITVSRTDAVMEWHLEGGWWTLWHRSSCSESFPFAPGAVLTEPSGRWSLICFEVAGKFLSIVCPHPPPPFSENRVRDGARSDSSETDVRTHHKPVKERVLKSFILHSCSRCCSELVERGDRGVPGPRGAFRKCKFLLLLVKLTLRALKRNFDTPVLKWPFMEICWLWCRCGYHLQRTDEAGYTWLAFLFAIYFRAQINL